jgi:alkylation response protein AidB-like acyl-CoA dehydrogenase
MSGRRALIPPDERLPDDFVDTLRESARLTDATGKPDPAAISGLRSSGVLAVGVPTEYGGRGGDAVLVNRVVERVARFNPSVAIILFQHCAVSARIAEWGTFEQKDNLLPRLASGELLAASSWSEPGAGAAKKKINTTATRLPGDRWVLDGTKSFTTGADVADIYLVLAQSGPACEDESGGAYGASGQSFFLVPGGTPGVIPDLSINLVGMRGSATGFVSLRQCEVDDTDRLGPLGEAPKIIAGVRESGATLGAVSVGIAQSLCDIAAKHFAKGVQPALRYRLVDLATQVEAARALVTYTGQRMSADPGVTTLHSKLFASTVAEQVGTEIARLMGSAGYVVDHQINQLTADARAVGLMGPASDLCRELVFASWGM